MRNLCDAEGSRMIIVGCCGFPISRKKYFQLFNGVEVQQTFYDFPKEDTLKRWRKEAPEDFVFTIKAFQGITHPYKSPTWKRCKSIDVSKIREHVGFLQLNDVTKSFWERTVEAAKILRAEVILIQTPKSFSEKYFSNALSFLEYATSYGIKIAIEFRGWGKEPIKKLSEKFDLLVVFDPVHEDPPYYSGFLYARLHGKVLDGRINYKYKYTDKELKAAAERIMKIQPRKAYIFFNNVFMVQDAGRFLEILKSLQNAH